MLRLDRLAVLALLLCPGAAMAEDPAPVPPTEPGAAFLYSAFGPDGLDLLASKGYVVLQGKKPGLRLISAQWSALEALAAQSASALRFARQYEDFLSGKPAEVPDASLSRLPASGLMTPSLRLAKLLLAASHEDSELLAGSGKASTAPGPSLFDTRWGRKFALRNHADSTEDPMPLAKPFFDAYLAGPAPDAEVHLHLTQFISYAYSTSVTELIAADAKAGAPSEELRAWLRKYLTDQRRLYALKRNGEELVKLDKRKNLTRDFADLKKIAGAFAKDPDLLAHLKEALRKVPETSRVRISSGGYRLDPPSKLGRNETGDAVTFSEGYWINGLSEGEKTEIEETTFADLGPLGAREVESHVFMRSNGGPYVVSRKVPVVEPKNFVLRSFVGAPGSVSLAESVDVAVTDDIQQAQRRLAEADRQALACDFKAAEASYEKLAADIEAPAKEKKQYKDLLTSAQWRKRMAKRDAGRLAKLEEDINASREDSSPQKCDYKTERTLTALRLARSLPAGCDKRVPELERQLSIILRRKDDQKNFDKAADEGRDLRKACRFAAASERWASALAILDADPAARCGAVDEQAKTLESGLVTARLEARYSASFDEDFRAAASAPDKETSLKLLRPVIARAASMPTSSCFEKNISGAMKLALTLGEAQYSTPGADVAAKLPDDKGLSDTSKEVADELRKMAAAVQTAKDKKAELQVPALPEPPPPPAAQKPEAPAPAAQAAPAPASSPLSRLECLEKGFKENAATVDCNGKDFDILELKRLRERSKAKSKTKKKGVHKK